MKMTPEIVSLLDRTNPNSNGCHSSEARWRDRRRDIRRECKDGVCARNNYVGQAMLRLASSYRSQKKHGQPRCCVEWPQWSQLGFVYGPRAWERMCCLKPARLWPQQSQETHCGPGALFPLCCRHPHWCLVSPCVLFIWSSLLPSCAKWKWADKSSV